MDTKTSTITTNLTKAEYGALRDALEHYYGDSLGLTDSINVDGPWTDINGIFKYNNKQDFNEKIFNKLKIPAQEINKTLANSLYLELTNSEIKAPNTIEFKEAEESPVSATLPDEITQETINDDAEKITKQKNKINTEEIRKVRASIEQQKTQADFNKQNQTVIQEREVPKDESADALFRKTGRQVIVTDNNFEDFTPTPTYVPTIAPTTISPKQEYIPEPKREETIEIVNNIQKGIEERSVKEQQIKASIQEKQIEYLSNVSKAREIKDVLEKTEKQTKVWVKVEPPPEPTPQIKVLRDRLQSQANASPKDFIKDVSEIVQKNPSLQNIPKDQAKIIAEETAYNLYQSTVTTSSPLIPIGITHEVINTPGVLDGITKDKKQQLLIQKANVEISNSKLGQYNLWRKLAKEQNLKIDVSLTERPGYTEVNVNELLNNETITPYISSYENQNSTLDSLEDFGKDRIKSEIINRAGQSVVNKISQLPEGNPLSQVYNHQLVQATLADAGFVPSTWTGVEGNFFVSTGHANVAGYFQKTFGIDFGLVEVSSLGVAGYSLAGGFEYYTTTALAVEYSGGIFAGEAFMGGAGAAMATETVGSAVGLGTETITGFGGYTTSTITSTMTGVGTETIAGATAAGATTTAGGVGIATVAGTQAIPGVGVAVAVVTAAAMAVKKVFSKIAKLINWPKVKSFFDKNKEMFLLGGILTVGSFPAIGAISILIGGASIIATGSFSFSGLFTSFMSLFSSFGSLFLTIGAQFFAWFIGMLLFIIFTLYIINTSAYVVPPTDSLVSSVNPYIDVQKVADPTASATTPKAIIYTITITAKRDTLTNIKFTTDCNAIKKGGTTIPCPEEKFPNPPVSIPSGSSFSFDVSIIFSNQYKDTLVSNTITVAASSPEGGDIEGTGSASVCFGQCPLDCFAFPDQYWPNYPSVQNFKSLLTNAAATLAGKYPNFAQKVCSEGTVNLCYNPNSVKALEAKYGGNFFAYHEHGSTCDIDFDTDTLGIGSVGALSILTHEASHHIQNIGGGGSYMSKFMGNVYPIEPSICYYGGLDPYESMAEGNALFVAPPVIYANASCLTNYQSQYPKHYDFAKNVMFGP